MGESVSYNTAADALPGRDEDPRPSDEAEKKSSELREEGTTPAADNNIARQPGSKESQGGGSSSKDHHHQSAADRLTDDKTRAQIRRTKTKLATLLDGVHILDVLVERSSVVVLDALTLPMHCAFSALLEFQHHHGCSWT